MVNLATKTALENDPTPVAAPAVPVVELQGLEVNWADVRSCRG